MTEADAKRRKLASFVRQGKFVLAPGVYDLISALLADRAGFAALYMTGYGTVASHLGLPDVGLATYSDMLGRAARIAERTQSPLIADADTGYGGLLNLRQTVRGYEQAGVSAIQIEDQQFPKKCGHTGPRPVISAEAMVQKISVVLDTRLNEDFLLVARTDARGSLGLDEAIRRGVAYARAGADIVFVEAPVSEAEMRRICAEIPAPLMANVVPGGKGPALPAATLQDIGYRAAILPTAGFLAAAAALDAAYAEIAGTGAAGTVPQMPFHDFGAMIGFPEVDAFEARFPET